MPTSTLRNAQFKDLGDTWYSHQTARIVQRHIQSGQHCRLDLDSLLVGVAHRLQRAKLDIAANECKRQWNRDRVDSPLLAQASHTFPEVYTWGVERKRGLLATEVQE
jgi:hypothetical protein